MAKVIFEITEFSTVENNRLSKSDQMQATLMSRRMARLVARKPNLAQEQPEKYAKYVNREQESEERANATRARHREEKPGVVHEELEQDDGSDEDVSRSDAGPLDRGPVKSGVGSADKKISKGADGHVATIAVTHKDSILMGKRRDNGKWTNPGGHMEPGEDAHAGAIRELKEESGIEADKVKHLGEKRVKTHTGRDLTIHAFHHDVKERPKTSMVLDPDQEVEKWQWIKHKDGKLPDHVKQNLHSPKNVVLEAMGLNKGGVLSVPQMREEGKKTGKENVGGGLVDKEIFYAYRKKSPTEEKTDQPAEITNKSRFFISDILKSGGHKYIRKYQHNGEWVYIYHEGDQHGRIAQEDIDAHHHLAQHGDEDERKHHAELISRIQTMTAEDVDHHKLLAEHGDEAERAHHKSILKLIGHKKKDDGLGKLESTVTQAERQDKVDQEMDAATRRKAIDAVHKEINSAIEYLNQHTSTPIAQAINPTLANDKTVAKLRDAKTIREVMTAAHEIAKKIEAKQGALTSSNSSVREHGGSYGNMIYNKAIEGMARAGVIPESYAKEHAREAKATTHEVKSLNDHQERAERAERERAEQERRELGELSGSMAFHMQSLMDGSARDRVAKARELDQAIKRIFGKSLKKEDFPYNFEGQGLKTKIRSMSVSGTNIHLTMQVTDADGNEIMENWEREWRVRDGRPNIYNSYMAVKSSMRGGAKVGDLINAGQRKLMKSLPRGGTVSVYAALDVGAYNWANQGFSFETEQERNSYRQNFKLFCQEKGIHLTQEDLSNFNDPVHFAAFTDGKKYIKNVRQYKLTPDQIRTNSLAGVEGQHTLTADEKRNGKSDRMLCHLGKAFMLGRNWHGEWDSNEATAASRHADEYRQMRERAIKVLEPSYQAVVGSAKAGERGRAAPDTRTVTPRSSLPSGTHDISEQRIRVWTPRAGGNIRLTKTRIDRVMRMDEAGINHFIANAPLTSRARNELRTRLRERTNG
jgi:8-oxo-dGTP pyrophosphatase MutT (NUDIX family)